MKKIVFLIITLLLVFLFIIKQSNTGTKQLPISQTSMPTVTQPQSTISQGNVSLFVPYWTVTDKPIQTDGFNELIYFGIAADANGVDRTDPGYKNIPNFFQETNDNTKKLLAVRLINPQINSLILKDLTTQKKIISDAVSIATYNKFDGIVLDFEVSALAFDNVIASISNFQQKFYTEAKTKNLQFDTMVFGDSIYRLRPYDISSIATHSDNVLVMAYDFHKANGDPGPNFPLSGKNIYGYDFQTMLSNFTKVVSKQKLSVVFGMFGYDWTVNTNEQTPAQSLSLNLIHSQFFPNCLEKNCVIKRDPISTETSITYTDANQNKHIVWYEDNESKEKKQEVLQNAGITQTAVWAYSYF